MRRRRSDGVGGGEVIDLREWEGASIVVNRSKQMMTFHATRISEVQGRFAVRLAAERRERRTDGRQTRNSIIRNIYKDIESD